LHLDNASKHRANDNFDRLGITKLPHRPYSPDIAPCDFWLFGNLKTNLEGNIFTDPWQIMVKVNEIIMDNPLHEFISVFGEWKPRPVEYIDTAGKYLQMNPTSSPALISLVPKTKNMSRDKTF
jgi:hypothetical protein